MAATMVRPIIASTSRKSATVDVLAMYLISSATVWRALTVSLHEQRIAAAFECGMFRNVPHAAC